MFLTLRNLKIAAAALLLSACATAPALDDIDGDIRVRAELISVDRMPGCGIIAFGSRAIYRVTSGPASLRGRRINVVVACIEFPMVHGDLREFTVGETHYLGLTRRNIHRVELPAELPDASWFHLEAASLRPLPAAGQGGTDLPGDANRAGR